MKTGTYFVNKNPAPAVFDGLYIRGLGIGEFVPPGTLNFGVINQYVLMYFHTPAEARINDEPPLEINDAMLLWDRGSRNSYGNTRNEWTHSWLVFGGKTADRLLERYKLAVNTPLAPGIGRLFTAYLWRMYDEISTENTPDIRMLTMIVETFLYDLERHSQKQHGIAPECIRHAADFVTAHLGEPLTLAEIAARANLSVPRFSALFRLHYGESPMHFVNRNRMMFAAAMLRNRTRRIKEISELCGFSNQLYFSKRFRGHWGMSPREFQQRNQ